MDVKRVYLEPEEAELIRKMLVHFGEAVSHRINDGQELINALREIIPSGIPALRIFLDRKGRPENVDEVGSVELMQRVDEIEQDLKGLKDEKTECKKLCEKLEDFLLNLHIDTMTS